MKVIGLTGGIGTGKSTVARFLAELGAVIIDADKVGHGVLGPGGQVRQKVISAFGQHIVGADGQIDREKLARVVFNDAGARERLNRIMHPVMYRMVEAQLEEQRQKDTKVAVLEAPLLLEAGWTPLVDEVWITVAPQATVLKRLRERTGMSEREALARIQSQLRPEERARHASVIIDTDCTLEEVKAMVRALWERISS